MARMPGPRQIAVMGQHSLAGATVHETVAVDDPALFAACALYDALARRGVVVIRGVRWARALGRVTRSLAGGRRRHRDARTSPLMVQTHPAQSKKYS